MIFKKYIHKLTIQVVQVPSTKTSTLVSLVVGVEQCLVMMNQENHHSNKTTISDTKVLV